MFIGEDTLNLDEIGKKLLVTRFALDNLRFDEGGCFYNNLNSNLGRIDNIKYDGMTLTYDLYPIKPVERIDCTFTVKN